MGIVTEYFMTRADGVVLNRTYSDAGKLIRREAVEYEEAIDPAALERGFVETDTDIHLTDAEALAALQEVLA